jgi:hypothetical protein
VPWLILRHTRNADYRLLLEGAGPGFASSALVRDAAARAFDKGLYGASEMVNDGFMRLRQAGILVRQRARRSRRCARIDGSAHADDRATSRRDGRWLDGGFYLGSQDLYDWLRAMPPHERAGSA